MIFLSYKVFILIILLAFYKVNTSTLVIPPQSAVIIAFEDVYELSLLANTISDIGIDTTLIISNQESNYYEHLVAVEIIKLNVTFIGNEDYELRALKLCENFILNDVILEYVKNTPPTFAIFPSIRHDACLLQWSAHNSIIPIIWARGYNEELYTFYYTGMALPVHENTFIHNFVDNLNLKYLVYSLEKNYISPAQKFLKEKSVGNNLPINELYSNVQLVLWGADPILRVNFALLTQLVAEIGCHHCRGSQPLPADLQKELIEYRSGSIIVLLDRDYESMIYEIAENLPNGRQGLAVVWKNKSINTNKHKPVNLFIPSDVDRQNLIGFSRTRLVLSHCTDSEFLESSFHGTPMICFPRTKDEKLNSKRAVELSFAVMLGPEATTNTVLDFIKKIHEGSVFRENARIVSRAIRDRSSHAMDRIQYWLGYTARHIGEGNKNLLVPKKVSTYSETLQTIVGFFVGVIFTVVLTVVYISTHNVVPTQRKKEHLKRHRK